MIKLKAAYSTLRPQPVPPAVQGVEWRGVIGRVQDKKVTRADQAALLAVQKSSNRV
jgi:hypothetical protein